MWRAETKGAEKRRATIPPADGRWRQDNTASRHAQAPWLDHVSRVLRPARVLRARCPGLGGKVGLTPRSKLVNYTITYLHKCNYVDVSNRIIGHVTVRDSATICVHSSCSCIHRRRQPSPSAIRPHRFPTDDTAARNEPTERPDSIHAWRCAAAVDCQAAADVSALRRGRPGEHTRHGGLELYAGVVDETRATGGAHAPWGYRAVRGSSRRPAWRRWHEPRSRGSDRRREGGRGRCHW